MKIVVLVKRVPDTASVISIAEDGRSIRDDNLKHVMNPYDEHAMEAAIQLQETRGARVSILGVGDEEARETLRIGLALGAAEARLIRGDCSSPRAVSKVLAAALRGMQPDLILAGKQAIDDDAAQVPERVAELLGLPHASAAFRMEVGEQTVIVDREVEGGYYTMELPLPALVSINKGINNPRYPKVQNFMKAKRMAIEEITPEELGLDAAAMTGGLRTDALGVGHRERQRRILEGTNEERARELVRILHEEEKVI